MYKCHTKALLFMQLVLYSFPEGAGVATLTAQLRSEKYIVEGMGTRLVCE